MAELDIGQSTTTNLDGNFQDFSVAAKTPDRAGDQKETWYDFPMSDEYTGYYKTIPELNVALKTLALWTVGKGVKTDALTKVTLERIKGWGEDSFQSIMSSMLIQKKALGDSFCEIIRTEDNALLNLKPMYPGDMRVVVNSKGIIQRYEQRSNTKGKASIKFNPNSILHISNDRFANEIHGTSVIEAVKWVIDARNEILQDHRKVLHRNVIPVRIIEIDTENQTKRNMLITQYESAIKKGEVLVIPKGTVEFKDNTIVIQDPLPFIQYLENFFYMVVGVPKVVIQAEGSEASSKVGFLSFDPVFTNEQTLLEQDLWNQVAIRVKFNRPPSLMGVVQEDEAKNTGQTGFQPNDTQARATRTE